AAGVDHRGIAVRSFEMEARDRVRRDPRQLALQIWKPGEQAHADSAATRLVAWKDGPVQQTDWNPGGGKDARGGGSGGSGADYKDLWGRRSGDHVKKCVKTGGFPKEGSLYGE